MSGYAQDLTQGPACAIAVGGATVYRNYFAKVGPGGRLAAAGEEEGVQEGQTSDRQLNLLVGLQAMLRGDDRDLIEIKNGYTFISEENLQTINFIIEHRGFDNDFIDTCRDSVRIGLQYDAEVYARLVYNAVRAFTFRRYLMFSEERKVGDQAVVTNFL